MYGIFSGGYETIGNHSINSAIHMTYTTVQYTVLIIIYSFMRRQVTAPQVFLMGFSRITGRTAIH